MNKKIAGIVISIVLIILGVIVIVNKKNSINKMSPPENVSIPVLTAVAKEGTIQTEIETLALIEAETSAVLSSQVSGNVIKVNFKEGDKVKKDEVMAVIDSSLYDDALESARVKRDAAEMDFIKQSAIYERDKVLYENGAISKQSFEISTSQFENAKANKVAAEKNFESANTIRNYCEVKSPYPCVVTERLVEPGFLVSIGKPLFKIQSPNGVKIISKFSQETLKRLKPNSKVEFFYDDKILTAKTTRIYPALDNLHLGVVETILDECPFSLPSGSTIKAKYSSSSQGGIVVPHNAVLNTSTGDLVIKIKDGKSLPVKVEVIGENSKEVVLKGDIHNGEEIIVGVQSELSSLAAGKEVFVVGGSQ